VIILIIVRIVLLLNPDPLYPLAITEYDVYTLTWEHLHRKNMNEPRILLIGSSRTQSMPIAQFTRNLDIKKEDVSNLSRPLNTFFSIHTFIKRNPDILNHCDLIIIDVLPVQLHKNKYFTQNSAMFFRYAALNEKLLINDLPTRVFAVADTVFPFHSMRFKINEWRIGLRYTHEQVLAYNRELLMNAVSNIRKDLGQLTQFELTQRALNSEFPKEDFLEVQARSLYAVFDAVSDEANIILIRPPFRADIEHIIQDDPQFRESEKRLKLFVDSIDRENVHTLWMDSPEAYNLTDDDYNDDGTHLSKAGLLKISNILSGFIKKNGLL